MIRIDLPAVIIAEAPPAGGCGPLGALDDGTGDRLAAAADITRERLLAGLERHYLGQAGAWSPHRAEDCAGDIIAGKGPVNLAGRVVLLAGPRVERTFAAVLGYLDKLPPLCRLRHAGVEWVPLPFPSNHDSWWKDKALRAEAGALVRHEVVRAERARGAWCSFGTDVLRHPDNMLAPDEGFTYNAFTGRLLWVPAHDAAGLALAQDVMADAEVAAQQPSVLRRREFVLETLARNLGRVLRWGGSSTCTVLAHSVRVAHLAAAVARHLPAKPDEVTVASCRRLGALHDLHEGLPGIGDAPNPTLRLLRHAVPTVDDMHRRAEELVLDLAGARSLTAGLAPAAVKFADRLAATVERAAYFSDAPAWMGPDLQRAGERMLRSTLPRVCLKWDNKATPDDLLALIRGGQRVSIGDLDTEGRTPWAGWCEDVLACLGAIERPWQSVLADMVQGT